ncbi:MAG: hypothetical protein M5T61_14770 [Acidimicrobiia bacterium]|nr:hypothetical protein [Acidimicrobiia bacterium]
MTTIPNQQRVEEFKAEIAEMRLKDPATARDRMLLRAGAALMIVGVVLAIVAYFGSHGTQSSLAQRDYLVTAVIGLCLTVAGGALFLRYSMAQFLRFWLARIAYEHQMAADRIIEGSHKGS